MRLLLLGFVLASLAADARHQKSHRRHGHLRAGQGDNKLASGTPVMVDGLQSAVELNKHEAVVKQFDTETGRYVIQMVDTGVYKKVTPEHLTSLPAEVGETVQEQSATEQKVDYRPVEEWPALAQGESVKEGDSVFIKGLANSKELNEQTGAVRNFDKISERFTIELPDGQSRRIKASHLFLKSASSQSESSDSISVCESNRAAKTGPGDFNAGMKVLVHGLKSAAVAHLNGKVAVVHCFDTHSNRYVVQLPDGIPREIKPHNLASNDEAVATSSASHASDDNVEQMPTDAPFVPVATEIETKVSEEALSDRSLLPGAYAKLVNLKAASLNGKVVKVVNYDETSGRFRVRMPDASVRKVDANKLQRIGQPPVPSLSICNVFGRQQKLQVKAIADKSSHPEEAKTIVSLDHQACADFAELPFQKGNLSFLAGSQEVGRIALDNREAKQGREVTVHRESKGSMKAKVSEQVIEREDDKAYYLHLINASTGSKPVKLAVQRGSVAKVLAMDKSYRMEKMEDISLVLSDGERHLKMAFKPQLSRTYSVVLSSGATDDEEVDGTGLMLHEIGAWTTKEELVTEQ